MIKPSAPGYIVQSELLSAWMESMTRKKIQSKKENSDLQKLMSEITE